MKSRHVTINGSPYFEEAFENPKYFARWVPHLLTDEQNRQRVKVAKKLLQMFQTYDKKQFANVVSGDENRALAIKSGPLNIADAQ